MLDKFLFLLSIEPICAAVVPLADDKLIQKISQCVRAEIVFMLGGKSNYYMVDSSKERLRRSKANIISQLLIESASDQVTSYISYLMDLFDYRMETCAIINLVIQKEIDRLLVMNFCVPSKAAFSIVEKLQQEQIYSSDFNFSLWISAVLASYHGPWAEKLQDEKLFDGIDDLLQTWMEEIMENFSLFAFIGMVKSICDQEELLAVVENVERGLSNSAAINAEIINPFLLGLQIRGDYHRSK